MSSRFPTPIVAALLAGCSGVAGPSQPPSIEIPSASPIADPGSSAAPRPSASASASTGPCKTRCLPNSDVDDTDDNRRVLAFCEAYWKAVEAKDIPALLSMASTAYHDDSGTPDPADDVDYAGLKGFFDQTLGKLDRIKVERHYRAVREQKQQGHVRVEYTASMSYVFPAAPNAVQKAPAREGQLELLREGASFKILKGM